MLKHFKKKKLSLDLILALCSYHALRKPHSNDESEIK